MFKKLNKNYKASIIIPSYNTEDLLKKNLPIVLKTFKNSKNKILEVILVDDASPDNSVKVVKELFPEIKVIRHKVNRGFSSSVNTGARTAKGELLVLLNTDVLPERDFLVKVLPHFMQRRVFAVSLNEKGFSWAKSEFVDGFIGHKPGKKTKEAHDTFWVSGGSGVFRRDYWMKLKGMDEAVLSPFYWEDLDLCYRALKRGYQLVWEPQGKVIHEHESTIGRLSKRKVQRIRERNQLLFIWKNLTSPLLFRKHLIGLGRRTLTHPGYLRIVLMALGRIKKVMKARKKEKKECRVSDEAILAKY